MRVNLVMSNSRQVCVTVYFVQGGVAYPFLLSLLLVRGLPLQRSFGMSGRLFAFRVAKPLDLTPEEEVNGLYDPQTQTSVWHGGTRPLAVSCTHGSYSPYGGAHCYATNEYGGHCTTYGGPGRYYCD